MVKIVPFSGLAFFIAALGLAMVIRLLPAAWRSGVTYRYLVFALSWLYAGLFFPGGLVLGGYAVVFYFAYLFAWRFRESSSTVLIVITLLPMVAGKLGLAGISTLGLSFMTFRALGALLEERGRPRPIGFVEYSSFLLFVPSLLVGPIDRFRNFEHDLGAPDWSAATVLDGWEHLVQGLILKFALAELVFRYWLSHFSAADRHLWPMANNAIGYSVFLYFDFAGYSSLAIGLGMLFGFRLPENFNRPYLARNFQDFWRRWHISLSVWLGDYVFRPLYMSVRRQTLVQLHPLLGQSLCLFATFALMGVWNGLRPRYLISGFLFGAFTAIHHAFMHFEKRRGRPFGGLLAEPLRRGAAIGLTLICASIAFYCFSGRMPWIAAWECGHHG
jgi:membrane protein involved in D-alanine export